MFKIECPTCGKVMYYHEQPPHETMIIHDRFYWPCGRPVSSKSPMMCIHCAKPRDIKPHLSKKAVCIYGHKNGKSVSMHMPDAALRIQYGELEYDPIDDIFLRGDGTTQDKNEILASIYDGDVLVVDDDMIHAMNLNEEI